MTRPDDHDWIDLSDFGWMHRVTEAQRKQARTALEAPIDYKTKDRATDERQAFIRQDPWWRRLLLRVVAWLDHVPSWR